MRMGFRTKLSKLERLSGQLTKHDNTNCYRMFISRAATRTSSLCFHGGSTRMKKKTNKKKQGNSPDLKRAKTVQNHN